MQNLDFFENIKYLKMPKILFQFRLEEANNAIN